MDCSYCALPIRFFERLAHPFEKRCQRCTKKLLETVEYCGQTVEDAFENGGISLEVERNIYQTFHQYVMPIDIGRPLLERLRYLRFLSEVRWGNIPAIRCDIHLDSDEYGHFSLAATYHKPNKEIKYISGKLLGTNKKMYFVSDTGKDSVTVDWNNVLRVTIEDIYSQKRTASGIRIQVAKGAGGGTYEVDDPFYAKIFIDALVRLWKRQLVLYKQDNTKGAIPEHIKATVFRRDNGMCIKCGYVGPYIEYDHIHPRSKGGTNTVENIQLLCRKCNLAKGSRI